MKQITRKRQKAGDILEIYIEDLGYIYFKIIDILQIKSDSSYPYLIRVYKKIYKDPIHNIADLDRQLLIPPKTISAFNGIMKVLPLRILANEEEILQEEKVLPDVKDGSPIHKYGFDASKYKKWLVIKELGDTMNSYYTDDYDKVRHLEWVGALNVIGIPFRIKLELLKLQGKDIKTEYGLKDWHEEMIYQQTHDLPIYSELDTNTRDFAYD